MNKSGKGDQEVKTSSYKYVSHGNVTYNIGTKVKNTVNMKAAERVNQTHKKNCQFVW